MVKLSKISISNNVAKIISNHVHLEIESLFLRVVVVIKD